MKRAGARTRGRCSRGERVSFWSEGRASKHFGFRESESLREILR